MELYVNLEKYSCDICQLIGKRPTYTVIHKDNTTVDVCTPCRDKAIVFPKFKKGIELGEIRIITR